MSEWIISDEDLGCDGAYLSYQQIVRCKDCKHWYEKDQDCERMVCCATWNPDDFCSYGEVKHENLCSN